MDTKINAPTAATPRPAHPVQHDAPPTDIQASVPEKVGISQAVPSTDIAYRPALKQAAPSSALTTYKDEDSGRLIVRVYDRESGDVLVEFPPEKAFRPVTAAPGEAPTNPKKSFSV